MAAKFEPPLSHEPPCPFCRHAHGLETCLCGCEDFALLGIDTAFHRKD